MFSRVLGIPVLLAAAVSVPYVATNGPDLGAWLDSKSKATPSNASEASGPGKTPVSTPQGPESVLYPDNTPLQRVKGVSLHEVFRFDISKEWVYQHWARKSTALSELGLYGIRVALVTGTGIHDLAGSLTYFFGQDGRVQRISFRGRTGDTTQVVMLVNQRYGLQPQPTAVVGEQLFQVRREGHVFSELRTRPTPVLWNSSPHDSFLVNLELQRPDATTPLRSQLMPFPTAAAQPSVAGQTAQAGSSALADAKAQSKEESSDVETWKAFFPRSRVPQEQVPNLEKQGRY